jgi:hypothetical protein
LAVWRPAARTGHSTRLGDAYGYFSRCRRADFHRHVGLDDILGGGFDPDRMYLVEAPRARARRRWRFSSSSMA